MLSTQYANDEFSIEGSATTFGSEPPIFRPIGSHGFATASAVATVSEVEPVIPYSVGESPSANWPYRQSRGAMEEKYSHVHFWTTSRGIALSVAQYAFRELDTLRKNDAYVRRKIDSVRGMADVACCEEIAERLTLLQSLYSEENAGRAMSADSIRSFGDFLRSCPNLRKPTLALTHEGYVYAKWSGEQGRLFSAEFLPSGDVSYVVFQPSNRGIRVNRYYGTTTADSLSADVLIPIGVLSWAGDER